MPIPILLGALAALGIGGALGTAQGIGKRKQEEAINALKIKQEETNYTRKVLSEAVLGGQKLPPDVVAKYFSKDAIPAFNMMAEFRQAQQQEEEKSFREFGGGQASGGQTALAQPPSSPGEMSPDASGAPEWALPGPTPNVAAFMPQAIRPSPGASMTRKTASGATMTKTIPGISEAEAARVGMEADRLRADQAKRPGELTLQGQAIDKGRSDALEVPGRLALQRQQIEAGAAVSAKRPGEMTLQQQQIAENKQKIAKGDTEAARATRSDAARVEASDLISRAAKTTDLREKLTLLEQSHAVAIRGDLKDSENISAQINKLRDSVSGKNLDLKDPNTAEYIATTGKNPNTNEPLPKEVVNQASSFVKAQTQRKLTQANTIAQGIASIQSGAIANRVAVSGAIKTLIKEGDNVAKAKIASDQIEEALSHIEKNIDVFPGKAITDVPSAYLAKLFQTDRGQRARAIGQSINVLQSLEARRIAGEQGRIANQIEQQWRDSIGNTTTTSQATMRQLIKRSRELKNAMVQGNTAIIRRNAGAARGVGVPSTIVDAFTKGDLDVLKSTMGEGLTGGALPTVIDLSDLDLSKAEQVK